MVFFLMCLEMLNYGDLENITITIPALRSVYRVIQMWQEDGCSLAFFSIVAGAVRPSEAETEEKWRLIWRFLTIQSQSE